MENSFGCFLAEKRKAKNLTQKKLAELMFVSESAVSKWEKNVAHPDISLLPKLAQILEVTEHELITASLDNKTRQEKTQAQKWRRLTFSWNMFFIISYLIALVTCFICNLAINKTLSWFWIVLASIALSASFTTIPQHLKKYRLATIPSIQFLLLSLLFLVCNIYTKANWFWIATISTLLGLVVVMLPICIKKYNFPKVIKEFNAYISLFIDYIILLILLIVINHHVKGNWFFGFALPLCSISLAVLYVIVSIKFLKINKFIKTSLILFICDIVLILSTTLLNRFISYKLNISDISSNNIFNANLIKWSSPQLISDNILLIIVLSIIAVSIVFLVCGINKHIKNKKTNS